MTAGRGARSSRAAWLVVGAAVALVLVLGLVEARRDSLTIDEGPDLSSGLTALVQRDARLTPEHPLGAKLVPSLTGLLARPVVPKGEGFRSGDWFAATEDFVRANQAAGRLDDLLWWSRVGSVGLTAVAAVLIFLLGRRLFGDLAGAVAAVAWSTVPYVIGVGHLAMIDVPFTVATLLVALALERGARRPGVVSAALMGASAGVALSVRQAGLVFVPLSVAVVVWVARRDQGADRRPPVRELAVVLLLPLVVVWALYRGLAPQQPGGQAGERLAGYVAAARNESVVGRLVLALPLPQEYRAGFAVFVVGSGPRPDFLLGRTAARHRWWSLPVSALLKLPPIVLLMLVAGPWWWRRAGVAADARARARVAVVAPALLLVGLLVSQPLDLGLRVALPSLALGLVAAAPAASLLGRRLRVPVLGGLAAVQLATAVVAFPASLAWTPPPFRPGYRWVSGGNLDLDQDRGRLLRWAAGRPLRLALVTSRGVDRPAGMQPLVGVEPSSIRGWVAADATSLTIFRSRELAWLRAYCPVRTIGGTILVYRFDRPPSASPGPDAPARPCGDGARYSHR